MCVYIYSLLFLSLVLQSKSAIKPKLFRVTLNTKFFDCARYIRTCNGQASYGEKGRTILAVLVLIFTP